MMKIKSLSHDVYSFLELAVYTMSPLILIRHLLEAILEKPIDPMRTNILD